MTVYLKRQFAIFVTVLSIIGVAACSNDGFNSSTRLQVVATTPVIADFVRQIGGESVDVHQLIQPGTDPHEYEPTPADINRLANADLIVKNGVGLEEWLDATIKSSESKALVVDASTNVILRRSTQGEFDPHIWHDARNAIVMVENIRAGLAAVDIRRAGIFAGNAANYQEKLQVLDASIRQQINSLTNKKLVTNHDAFGYYVAAYGLQYVGSVIPSFDSQAELSSAEMAQLVEKIKAEGVKAVFAESSLPPKTAHTIAQEANVRIVQGDDALYGDSLGAKNSTGRTYVEMEEHNTNVIVSNLS